MSVISTSPANSLRARPASDPRETTKGRPPRGPWGRSFCPFCDPQVVTSEIKDPEVCQPPGTVLEMLAEGPSRRLRLLRSP